MEESEGRYILIPVRLTFWSLYRRHGLQLYLSIPRVASLACPKEGYCVGSVVQRSLCYIGENVWCTTCVFKLRAILLMEADFNAMNKEVYGVWMLDNVRQYNLIPEEIFSKQNCTADDGGLAKMLFYDIARQACTPAAIASQFLVIERSQGSPTE